MDKQIHTAKPHGRLMVIFQLIKFKKNMDMMKLVLDLYDCAYINLFNPFRILQLVTQCGGLF